MLDTYWLKRGIVLTAFTATTIAAGAVKLSVPEWEADFGKNFNGPKLIIFDLLIPPLFMLN